jgi:hypothetical protein
MRSIGTAVVAFAVGVAVFACSGGGGGCLQSMAESLGPDCYACLQTSCSQETNTVQSDCSAYLSCACPDASFSSSAAMSSTCAADEQQSSCQTAESALDSCTSQSCSSQCSGSSEGGTGSSSGGGISSSSSGGSGTMTTCTMMADCPSGVTVESCVVFVGSTCTAAYYLVNSQMVDCPSCTDTTGCAQTFVNECQ